MIAGDRAAGPLAVARENARLYLRHARKESSSAAAAPVAEGGAPRVRRYAGFLDTAAGARGPPPQGIGDGIGEGEVVDAADVPRLECRLGEGLAVLEPGEVDTVCIAGVGEYFLKQAICSDLGKWRGRTVQLRCHSRPVVDIKPGLFGGYMLALTGKYEHAPGFGVVDNSTNYARCNVPS